MNECEDGSKKRGCNSTQRRFTLCETAYYDVTTTQENIRFKIVQ